MIKFGNLLICLAALACLVAPAIHADPLNPGMLGETMDMPLPPDLVQKAVKAGVIKSASQVTGPLPSGSQPVNLGTPPADSFSASQAGSGTHDSGIYTTGTAGPVSSGATDSQPATGDLEIRGTLSLMLQGSLTRYMTLIMEQSGKEIAGMGNLTIGSSIQEVTANGLIEGTNVDLMVTPAGSSDLYRLSFHPEGNILKGDYSIQFSSGESASGNAIGIMSNPNGDAGDAGSGRAPSNQGVSTGGAGATPNVSAKAGPVQLGGTDQTGRSYSSTKSISMSTTAGGSMSSSTSVSSNMGI